MARGEAKRFFEMAMVYDSDECCIWPFARRGEDGRAKYTDRKIPGSSLAHRRICEWEHGPPPTDKHEAAHSCGNGHLGCINPRHVSWKTSKENKADQLIHGTRRVSEDHGMAKLSNEQVIAIKEMAGTMFQIEIAVKFGVSKQCIQTILAGTRRNTIEGVM